MDDPGPWVEDQCTALLLGAVHWRRRKCSATGVLAAFAFSFTALALSTMARGVVVGWWRSEKGSGRSADTGLLLELLEKKHRMCLHEGRKWHLRGDWGGRIAEVLIEAAEHVQNKCLVGNKIPNVLERVGE